MRQRGSSREMCTSVLYCSITKKGELAIHHQCNSCIMNCCSLRLFKDTVLCRLYLHRITPTVIPLHTHQSTEHQSSIDDVDCSCQKRNLLYKLDESFCARHSEMDDYNLMCTIHQLVHVGTSSQQLQKKVQFLPYTLSNGVGYAKHTKQPDCALQP